MGVLVLRRFQPEPPLGLRRFGPDGRLSALAARVPAAAIPVAIAPPNDFNGFGGIDYTDTQAGTAVELPAGQWVTVTRDLAASIGVIVNETISDTAIAAAAVSPNDDINRPTIPVIKPTGMKTASSESVVAKTAKPISLVPSIAA